MHKQLREDLENIVGEGLSDRQAYRRNKAEDQYYGSQARAPQSAKAQAAKVFKQKRQMRMAQALGRSPRVKHMRTGQLEPYAGSEKWKL